MGVRITQQTLEGSPRYRPKNGTIVANSYLDAVEKPVAARSRPFDSGLSTREKKGRVRVFVLAGQRIMEGEYAFVAQISQPPRFEGLSRPQNDVLFRYSLGGGVQSSRSWEPLGPIDELGNFGPELSLVAHRRTGLQSQDSPAVLKFTHSGAQATDWSPAGSPQTHRNLCPKLPSSSAKPRTTWPDKATGAVWRESSGTPVKTTLTSLLTNGTTPTGCGA